MSIYHLIKPLLFTLPTEASHHVTMKSLNLAYHLGLLPNFTRNIPANPCKIMGIEFPNRLGLAAGLDKNGQYYRALSQLGFGFIEIGTITPKPQPGNPKPRLFRLKEHQALINRMGFNNKGLNFLLKQLENKPKELILGINIGKNATTPIENAVDDYLVGLDAVYPFADYIAINISSPNTANLRDLQLGERLDQLLSALKTKQEQLAQTLQYYRPIAIKISPDLTEDEIRLIAKKLLLQNRCCYSNKHNHHATKTYQCARKNHGRAGWFEWCTTFQTLNRCIKECLAHALEQQIPIIAVGGISSGDDALAKIKTGASLVQIYTGLIYQGPHLIKEIVSKLHEIN